MAKFAGAVGYATSTVETAPGVWEEQIIERVYYGDIVRNSRSLQISGENVNRDISVENSIRILADEYASMHLRAIRYVRWTGTLWTVTTVEVQRPRLVLGLGGVYNGPTPD